MRASKKQRTKGQEEAPPKEYDLGDGDVLEYIPDDPDVPVGDYDIVTEDEASMEEFLESWK